MKKNILKTFMAFCLLLSCWQLHAQSNQYYLAMPHFVRDFQSYSSSNYTYKLVIKNGPVADVIKYQFMNYSGAVNVSSVAGGVVAADQVVYCDIMAGSPQLNCAGTTGVRLYNDKAVSEIGKGLDTGLLKVYSVGGAKFEAYFETTNGAKDVIYRMLGDAAVGREFLVPGQNLFNTDTWFTYCHSQTYQNVNIGNTTASPVTFTITSGASTFRHFGSAPLTTLTYTLGAYQTTTVYSGNINAAGNMGGMHILASGVNDKLVVTLTDDLLNMPGSGGTSGQDPAGDQVPAMNYLGKNYLLHTGVGTTQERFYIYSTQGGTTTVNVRQHGGGTTTTTLTARGQFVSVAASPQTPYFIDASQPVIVYQMSGIGNETGSAIVPPLGCNGSSSSYVVKPILSSAGDKMYLMLITNSCFSGNFKFYKSPLSSRVSGTWTDVTSSIPITWKTQSPICSNSDAFRSALIEIPANVLLAGQALKVVNTAGVFHMGMLFNNSSSTSKFTYLSSFQQYKYTPKVKNKSKYCQYEDIIFCMDGIQSCTKYSIDIYKNGTLLGSSADFPSTDCFNIKDLIPNINTLMGSGNSRVGNYTLKYRAKFTQKICGQTTTCSDTVITHPFTLVKDADTVTTRDTIYYCDWGGWVSKPNCAVYNPCPNFPSKVTQFYPVSAPVTGKCLGMGKYYVDCYDTMNCRVYRTILVVSPKTPPEVIEHDTITFCDWRNTLISKPTCARYRACGGNLPFYWSDDPETYNASGLPDMCLNEGKYIFHCFDTFNCRIVKTYLVVKPEPPAHEVRHDTISYCDWSNTIATGTANCAKYNVGTMPHVLSDDPETYNMAGGPVYCLSQGRYIITSFDTSNCKIITTYLRVLAELPHNEDVGTDTLRICQMEGIATSNCYKYKPCNNMPQFIETDPLFGWGMILLGNPDGSYCLQPGHYIANCLDTANCRILRKHLTVITEEATPSISVQNLEVCQIPGVPSSGYVRYTPCSPGVPNIVENNTLFGPPGVLLGNPDGSYNLYPGHYIATCFDTLNCKIKYTNISVVPKPVPTINTYDTFTYCNAQCYNYQACNMPRAMVNTATNAPVSGTVGGLYCLEAGNYKLTCYDTTSCTIWVKNITIKNYSRTEKHYINFCGDSVMIYASEIGGSVYQLYDGSGGLLGVKFTSGFKVKANMVYNLLPKRYSITTYFPNGCNMVDSFIITCCPPRDHWDEVINLNLAPPATMNLVASCPGNCSVRKTVSIMTQYPFTEVAGTRYLGGNTYLVKGTDATVRVECYDEFGCVCYSKLYNVPLPPVPPYQPGNNGAAPAIMIVPTIANASVDIQLSNMNEEHDKFTMYISDLSGKIIRTIDINEAGGRISYNMDLFDFAAGMYYVRIPEYNLTGKFIKN